MRKLPAEKTGSFPKKTNYFIDLYQKICIFTRFKPCTEQKKLKHNTFKQFINQLKLVYHEKIYFINGVFGNYYVVIWC